VAGPPQGVGPHTDIYALGAILFELLTGQPPFGGKADPDLRKRLVLEEPVRPRLLRQEVPRDLETIALKCLEKEPPHRYPSALAVADDLRSFLNAKPLWARPPGVLRRLWRRYRRRQALARNS
jgi:serine/threonine protein kinase